LHGTTQWPTVKELRKLGETRAGATPAKIRQILASFRRKIRERLEMASIVDAGDNRFAGQNRDEIKAEDFGRFWGKDF
jgi:uncharacterized protein YjiS (DUF1127 family)